MRYANNFKGFPMLQDRITVEPVHERGLEALRITITIPPGVLVQATPVAEREVEGYLASALEAVHNHLTQPRSGVAA